MSDEIERLVSALSEAAEQRGYHSTMAESGKYPSFQQDMDSAEAALLTAIAALRAERDALQVHLRAAEEAAGHSEFLSSPLYSTIAKIVAERDAAQAEAARLTSCLKAANDQAERFEREWYLRGDEVARLREALQFYADREHLSGDDWSKWDWADMDTINWLCPDSDESLMVEDGFVARAALESKT